MKRSIYLLPLFIFLVIVGYFAVGLNMNPRDIPSMLLDQKVPHFDLAPIKGSKRGFSHKDLSGQVALINIFGSWCAACLAEHPFLMEISTKGLIPIYGIDWREKNPDDGNAQRIGQTDQEGAPVALTRVIGNRRFADIKAGSLRQKVEAALDAARFHIDHCVSGK